MGERTIRRLGAVHTIVPGDGVPSVVTTDIVCQYMGPLGSVIYARSVKPSKEIEPSLGIGPGKLNTF